MRQSYVRSGSDLNTGTAVCYPLPSQEQSFTPGDYALTIGGVLLIILVVVAVIWIFKRFG